MAKLAVLLFMILTAVNAPAMAQGNDQPTTHKVAKVVIGSGAIAIGAAIAAKSSQTTTVTSPLGTTETSSFSTTQLATGLTIAGVGGFLLWDGLRHHEPRSPRSSVAIAAGKRSAGVFFRRNW